MYGAEIDICRRTLQALYLCYMIMLIPAHSGPSDSRLGRTCGGCSGVCAPARLIPVFLGEERAEERKTSKKKKKQHRHKQAW